MLVTAFLFVVLFASVAGVTLYLKQVSERAVLAERDLQGVSSELNTQDALEWRAISGRMLPAEVVAPLAASRARMRALIERAGREGLPASAQARLDALHQAYGSSVDQELQTLATGRITRPDQFSASAVDPNLAAAEQALTGYERQISDKAARARVFSDLGILLTVALSLMLTVGVQRRLRLLELRRQSDRRSGARYRTLVDQSADIAVITAPDGTVQYLSPAAENLLGPHLVESGADLADSLHPADRELLAALLATTLGSDQPSARLELRVQAIGPALTNPDDEPDWRIFDVSVQDMCDDPAVRGVVLTGHDITDRQALQREIEYRALHDGLTGLPNRALLADRLDQALRAGERQSTLAGLLLIDLDRFKEINDTLGHEYGDQLLIQVGPRLAGALRAVDTVARLGGDEFAVLLPVVSGVEAAIEVANKLQEALGRPFRVQGVDLDVEASIGVVVAGEHGNDPSTLMQRADIAMYAAKQRSLGVASYDEGADSHTPERLALLGDLRRALSSDELFLLYQPKISLRTGEVCGAEALIRWRHPERGIVPPDSFIPLAENTGLIGPLTTYVLDLALAQARRWVDQDAGLQVAVNLSARNLLDEKLDENVAELLAWHGIDPHLLKLEITESAVMTDPTRAAEVLERLAAQGIAISIDDFGAGYTSIRQLRDLPISELKVDRSFVTSMENDPSNSTIVRSVIELGHNLGMTAVAEGIESLETLNSLTAYACDVAQGYFLSRPLTAEDFDTWRKSWAGLPGLPVVPEQRSADASTV